MLDLKLTSDGWDLQFTEGDLVLTSDVDQSIQHIKQRLLTFYQEWFLNLNIGIPWIQQILEKPASLAMVEVILQKIIRDSPEVKSLSSFTVAGTDQERTIEVTFTVVLDQGSATETVQLEVG
jgi:hypothetical protein